MANSNSVKFIDNSDPAKNGLMEQQKLALKAVAKMLRKRVKGAVKKDDTGALKKNIGTWVKVTKKTGEVKLFIGVFSRATSKKKGYEPASAYAHFIEFGSRHAGAFPFLKPTIMSSIADIRATEAEYLPDIKPYAQSEDEDAEVD